MIAVGVEDLATHEALLANGGYRPGSCPRCKHPRPHLHDYRSRRCQRGARPVTPIARFRCSSDACRAQWQVLPGFIARWLHYNWDCVEAYTRGDPPPRRQGRPAARRTVERWRSRMFSSAARLARLLGDHGGRILDLKRLATISRRLELVDALSASFAAVASQLHTLMPGVRLM